jgi:glycosyltransferase involved in cell wall biosynthesis
MDKILFATHDNLDRTPVAKAMLEDIATKLQENKEFDVRIFSSGQKRGINGNRYIFSRSSYGKLNFKTIIDILMAYSIFFKAISGVKIVLIRSYPTFIFIPIIKFLKKYIIFDTRGLWFDELYDSGVLSSKKFFWFLYKIEKFLLNTSNEIICVTQAQANHYFEKYGIDKKKLSVIPNGAKQAPLHEDRSSSEYIKFCYVGSLVKWHMPYLVRDFCRELNKININFSLDVITKDIEKAKKIFTGFNRVNVFTHNYREKPIKYDYGFCFISGGISKTICYPVKFNEYVQSGTPILSILGVDEVERLINEYDLGINFTNQFPKKMISEFLDYHASKKSHISNIPYELTFDYQYKKVLESIRRGFKG